MQEITVVRSADIHDANAMETHWATGQQQLQRSMGSVQPTITITPTQISTDVNSATGGMPVQPEPTNLMKSSISREVFEVCTLWGI